MTTIFISALSPFCFWDFEVEPGGFIFSLGVFGPNTTFPSASVQYEVTPMFGVPSEISSYAKEETVVVFI